LQGDGHFCLFGTLEIGHTLCHGVQRVVCFPFPGMDYYAANREDYVFVRPPGVTKFELTPDNVWYGRIKLLFSISVQSDVSVESTKIDCAYVSFCYEIELDTEGKSTQFVQ
jgi:hypothetical protein